MHRLTARILLVLVLVSTLVPVAMAVNGPCQHACCLRMMHSHRQAATLQTVPQAGGNCCPPMTTQQWAQVSSAAGVQIAAVLQVSSPQLPGSHNGLLLAFSHTGRAPPTPSLS